MHTPLNDLSPRLDRLPITPLHRTAIYALAFAYFFELGDLNTFAYAAPGIIRSWHIPVRDVAFITSMAFGGMFIGAILGGRLADAVGRKRGFILAILLYAVTSLLNALAWDIVSLGACRLLTGVGLSAMTVIANSYTGEFFPARIRGKYMSVIVAIGLIGIPATAWVARILVPIAPWGWRLVFIWGALGILAMPFALRMIESPRWQASRGRWDDAEHGLSRLEALASAQGWQPAPGVTPSPLTQRSKVSFGHLFAPGVWQRTVILLLASIFQTVGAYGFLAWVPTLLVAHGFSLVNSLEFSSIMAICNPLGAGIAILVIEHIERKLFIGVNSVLIAVFGLFYGLSETPALIVLFGALVVLTLQAIVVGLYTYMAELYPTDIRATGVGVVYGIGRLANVFGPFLISALFGAFGYFSVFLFISGCWLIVAISIGGFGPKATGKSLEFIAGNEA